ncbi:TonB-dependent siderophore receptor [Sphingobium xenophagum]|nr:MULTISPECIES: TonB-dependent receptor [Sphingomonadaceae]
MFGGFASAERRGRRFGVMGAVLMATSAMAGLVATPAAAQSASARRGFDIPSQSLAQALMIFGRQAGLQVTAEGAVTEDKTSTAVKGELAPAEALSQMLTGTGLTFRFVGNGVQIETAPQSSGNAIQLGPVQVEGAAGTSRSGDAMLASEGTGSYAAQAVTIGRQAQSLKEIPNSVSVVTRQQIEDRNINSVADGLKQVAGVQVVQYSLGNFGFTSRGMNITTLQVDGLQTADTQGAWTTDSFDISFYDRIELVRGPAALFQGSSEPGGAVNLVRKRALADTHVNIMAQAGSWDRYRGELDVTGRLDASGSLRGRLVAAYDDRGSYMDHVFARKLVLYGTLEYDITPDTTVSVGAIHQGGPSRPIFGLPTYDDGGLYMGRRSVYMGSLWDRKRDDAERYFVDVEHHLDNGGMIRLRGDRTDRAYNFKSGAFTDSYIDRATGNVDIQQIAGNGHSRDEAVDLSLTLPTLFTSADNLVIGVNHSRNSSYTRWIYGPVITRNIFNPDPTTPEPAFEDDGPTTSRTIQTGLYANARFKLVDRLTLTAGGRLSWYKGSANWQSADSKASARLVPYAALSYDITPELSAYASYSATFVPQTSVDRDGNLLKPRTGTLYELGLKGQFLDGALTGHAALYQIIDRNRAMTDPDYPDASVALGKVRSRGFEAEVVGEPATGWNVTLGYAYTRTRYLTADEGLPGLVFAPGTPEHDLKLWAVRDFSKETGRGLILGGGVNVSSGIYAGSGDLEWKQKAYALLSAQIGYQFSERFSLRLTGENLTDKKYYTRIEGWSRQSYFGDPRNVMLTARMGF